MHQSKIYMIYEQDFQLVGAYMAYSVVSHSPNIMFLFCVVYYVILVKCKPISIYTCLYGLYVYGTLF